MKVWIITFENKQRGSGYICAIYLDQAKAIDKLGELGDYGNDPRYNISEYIVSE